jgi:hypothetical protein
MIALIVVGEGQTEETFVRSVLAPALGRLDIFVEPRLIKTSGTASGGALNLARVRQQLKSTLAQRTNTYVTTFFDLYGLDTSFPGVKESRGRSPTERASQIEALLADDVIAASQCRRERFIPHIQPHEFEAILFSNVSRFSETEAAWAHHQDELSAVQARFATPEHINDSPETAPSKLLARILKPRYRKTLHGPDLANRIGLDEIREKCPHFRQWFERLSTLEPL